MAVNLEVEHVSYMIEEFPETASIWQEQHPKGQPTQWKGKGKEVEIPSIVLHTPPSSSSDSVLSRTKSLGEEEEQDQEVDWRSCEPPTGLNNVDGVDSEIVIELVQQSIKKVKWRILEEEEQRQRRAVEELETLSRECEENAKTNKDEEADANSLTQSTNERAVVPDDTRTTTVPRYHSIEPASFAGVRLVIDEHGLLRPAAASPTKSRKGGLLGLLRRFNTTEKAESSAQGAVRNQQNTPVGNPKLATFATKRKSAANVIKKAVSNDSPRTSVHEEDVECVSCFDDIKPKDTIKAPCRHSYCAACFEQLIETACENEQQWPPKCCLSEIPTPTIASALFRNPTLEKKYKAKRSEYSTPIGDRVYCTVRSCDLFVAPDHVYGTINAAQCSSGHWICTLCRGPQHDDGVCPQGSGMPDPDLQRTQELAEEEGWKRCHQCHAFVEHREACQHMTCRCGAEFCYVCGARWRTCACNMEQLHALKQAAEVKRQARDLRQTQEEAETAEALRLVEEFEREEERKTILLRLERQRVEQERREKQLRERLHKEEERREAVKVTYQELRQILDSLHDRQQAEVVRDHGKEESILTHSAQALMTALVEGNKAERRAVVADGDRKLTDMIVALEIEYNNRVEQEREVEEEYRRQLCAYWAGKEDGDAQIQAELLRLRHRMDQGYSTWEKWMQNEVGTQRFLVQEEQTIKLELMDETEKRLTQESKQAQRAFVRNKQADLSWVEVIIHERQDMLRLLEEDDLGNGDDMADLLGEGEGEVGGWGDVDELDEYPVPGAFR